jgi:hypothetical protein
MQLPKQPLMLYVNDKIYLPNPAEPGAFVPASPEAAAALEAKDAENVALAAKIAEYEAHDGMHGAVVHAIRSLLNENNVPGAAFIDDHVANAIVQRDAFAAQVAELTRERDEARVTIAALKGEVTALEIQLKSTLDREAESIRRHDARMDAAEATVASLKEQVKAMRGALRDIDALDPEVGHIGACSENAIRGLVLRMGSIARAALSATTKE